MPTASETTATVEHQPIVIRPQWDAASVYGWSLGGPALLVAVMLLWLKTQFVARSRVGASRADWAAKMSDPNALEVLAAYHEHKKGAAKIADAVKKAGLQDWLK